MRRLLLLYFVRSSFFVVSLCWLGNMCAAHGSKDLRQAKRFVLGRKKNFARAVPLLKKVIKASSDEGVCAQAHCLLGEVYATGDGYHGVSKSFSDAVGHYGRAFMARKHLSDGGALAGFMLHELLWGLYEECGDKDLLSAAVFYGGVLVDEKLRSDRDNVDVLFKLAQMYLFDDNGTEQEVHLAKSYLERMLALGKQLSAFEHSRALYLMGTYYSHEKNETERDSQCALGYYHKILAMPHIDIKSQVAAHRQIGYLHFMGTEDVKDYGKAYTHLTRAIAGGDYLHAGVCAVVHLRCGDMCCEGGFGLPQNIQRAVEHYHTAAVTEGVSDEYRQEADQAFHRLLKNLPALIEAKKE